MGANNKPNQVKILATMKKAEYKPLEPYRTALTRWKCLHVPCGNVVYPKYNTIQQGGGACRTCYLLNSGSSKRLKEVEVKQRLQKKSLTLIGNYKNVSTSFEILCGICDEVSRINLETLSKKGRGSGCEKCCRSAPRPLSEKKVIDEMLEKGLKPLEKYAGSKKPWLCECLVCHKKKRVRRDTIMGRTLNFQGCISCAKKSQNKKRIKDSEETVLKRFRDKNLKLIGTYIKARQAVEVECLTCGHIFETEGLRLSSQKYSCGKCAGNYVDPIEAKEFMILNGYIPKVEFPGAHTSWKSKHLLCGNDATPSYTTIKSGSGGCKHCAKHGFQYSKPAYLYLITKPAINSHKIGIANPAKVKKSDRLHKYQYHGWQVFKIWNFKTGKAAEQVENSVLIDLRVKRKIPIHLSKAEMSGQGGHTETMSADSITLLELEKIIKKVIKGYRD